LCIALADRAVVAGHSVLADPLLADPFLAKRMSEKCPNGGMARRSTSLTLLVWLAQRA
jgi:hypothetical protein